MKQAANLLEAGRPHRFTPGKSGNPKGRPRKPKTLDVVRDMLHETNDQRRCEIAKQLAVLIAQELLKEARMADKGHGWTELQ